MRRRDQGFSLIEFVVVLAIIGAVIAISVPMTVNMRSRGQARTHATAVMSALQTARETAIQTGQPTWILFDDPQSSGVGAAPFGPGIFAVVARDVDNDGYVIDNDSDIVQTFTVDYDIGRATGYGLTGSTNPLSGIAPPAEDNGSTLPADLDNLVQASTFPVDVGTTSLKGVAFTTQGLPVSIPNPPTNPPGGPGTGAGAYYVTDNDKVVYAVILEPLGGIRIRALNPGDGTWN